MLGAQLSKVIEQAGGFDLLELLAKRFHAGRFAH
jgi:hypothetical protein